MENYFKMNLSHQEITAISNLGLAHMGDCVFEILCRGYLCAKGGRNVGNLHRDTINMVNATSQAKFMDKLLPHLTQEELAYYRRGKKCPCPCRTQILHPCGIRQGHRPGSPVRCPVSRR